MALAANVLLMGLALLLTIRLGMRYRERRKPHNLAYAVSFLMIAAAAFFDLYAHLAGAWPQAIYVLYWLTVATLVPVMGAGTLYLFNRNGGHLFLGLSVLAGLAMAVRAFGLTVDPAALVPGDIGSLVPAPQLQVFTKNLPRLGALVILAGAGWSWYKQRGGHVLWIALGTVLFSLAGILAARGGSVVFYTLQAAAILAFYKGVPANAGGAVPVEKAASSMQ